ncbi:hypothetical protein [Streptomyces shaanxiensis]
MRSLNVWQALTRSGYLRSGWPWRAAAYLLSSAPVGIVVLLAIVPRG